MSDNTLAGKKIAIIVEDLLGALCQRRSDGRNRRRGGHIERWRGVTWANEKAFVVSIDHESGVGRQRWINL